MLKKTVPLTDLEIASQAVMRPIGEIAEKAGIPLGAIEPYGRYKAKIDVSELGEHQATGKVVLVTATSPTPAGEGKSTVTVGLADALQRLGEKSMIALREPSLGPVMGVKGERRAEAMPKCSRWKRSICTSTGTFTLSPPPIMRSPP